MKRIAAVTALLLVVAAHPPAFAQTQAQTTGGEAKGMTQQTAPEKPQAGTRQRARPAADARHCLQSDRIVEIIKCAEKYR